MMLDTITQFKSSVLAALLLTLALVLWVDPYTKAGNAALALVGFVVSLLLLRAMSALVRRSFLS